MNLIRLDDLQLAEFKRESKQASSIAMELIGMAGYSIRWGVGVADPVLYIDFSYLNVAKALWDLATACGAKAIINDEQKEVRFEIDDEKPVDIGPIVAAFLNKKKAQ
jgi:hypothetical protein